MPSNQPKGILSPERQTLSAAQRQEYVRLKAQGVEDAVARALAMALAKSEVRDWLKKGTGKKPLGAAFSHGNRVAREKGGGKKKAKAAAQAYLKREGHEPMSKGGPGSGPSAGGEALRQASVKTLKQLVTQARAQGDHARAERILQRVRDQTAEQLRSVAKSEEPKHADPKTKGAAFQYARRLNRQRGGDKKAERQIAEDYLTRRGHKPLKVAKSAEPASAELACQALEAVGKSAFAPSFVSAAKEELPGYFYDKVHARARAAAGGKASGASRRKASGGPKHLKELRDLQSQLAAQLAECEEQLAQHPALVAKALTPSETVHVDVPLGSQSRKKRTRKKFGRKALENVLEKDAPPDIQMAHAAYVAPERPEDQKLTNAARLVAGMDWEIFVGAADAEDARARASRQLAQDLAYYDGKMQRDEAVRGLRGIDLDLGSGQARMPGYLGLDLYPYDHGTAVHDLGLGIPLPDMSCRAVRLVNALQFMPDYIADPTPLLVEVQRVLNFGGKLEFEGRGDLTQMADWSQLPGLVLVAHEDTKPLPGQDPTSSDLHFQTFERVRVRVPRIFGADPTWLGGTEEGPEDIAFAMAAMGGNAPAGRAMEALLVKSSAPVDAHMDAPLTNAELYKKIIYSVVYAPNERDYDGEYIEADDIEKMAHDAYRNQVPIKVEHGGDPIGAHIVESYIAPADFMMKGQAGPQHVPQGAWVMAIQFTDDAQWQKVLNGEYRGVSVGGRALYENR